MSDSKDSPLDLSGLDFGPAWAKDKTPARNYSKEVGPRESRDRRGKGPRRESGGRKEGDRRQQNDRRDQRGDRRRNDRRSNDRSDDRRNQREPRTEAPAPEGYMGGVMPVEEGLDNLSREIQGGGRTYSVFDLARVVMGARDRFNVTFEAPKGSNFFRCKSDGSLWLTKEEAVRHFWQANLLSELYEEVANEVEAPKGNFTSVAKCGLSGQWLAPPNYHSYPIEVARIHAERFSHLSLEDYKRKIRVENGEEVVAAWLETQKKKLNYRPLSSKEILALRDARKAATKTSSEAPKNEQTEESKPSSVEATESPEAAETAETPLEVTEPVVEATADTPEPAIGAPETIPETSDSSSSENTEALTETAEQPEATSEPEVTAPAELLENRRDVERHFADHHFKHIFAQVERAWVPGNISARLLSPALLTLLKATVADERRYPSKLTPVLCRQLSGRHLAVFKWKKKLKAGPARPHAVPDDLDLAERPQKMLVWISEQDGKTLEELWKAVLPENADKELKQHFYRDFHWLLNQGFVLLMADSTVHLAKAKTQPKAETQAPAETLAEAKTETETEVKVDEEPQPAPPKED